MLSLHGSRTERIQPEEKEKCTPPSLLSKGLKAGSHVRRKHKSASISTSTKTMCEPGRRKHKRKHRSRFTRSFSCAYAYTCVLNWLVHLSVLAGNYVSIN